MSGVGVALLAALALLVWVVSRMRAQSRALVDRLGQFEETTRDSFFPGESRAQRKMRLFRRFRVSNSFEGDNIVPNIVALDEYGLGDLELRPDDVVVDVGAHIGTFSYLCHILGSRRVHAFEPWPENFGLLEENLGYLPGVSLSQKAVWRSDGGARARTLELAGPIADNTGACSALRVGDAAGIYGGDARSVLPAPLLVEAIPLDEILARFGRVRLLKMDCEGSEFPILLTSRELHRVERLVAEVHDIDEAAMSLLPASCRVGDRVYRLATLVTHLQSAGFRVRTHPATQGIHMLDAQRRD